MTTSAFSPAPNYTISGIGPYDVPHDYGTSDELVVSVVTNDVEVALDPSDYSVVPTGPATLGTVFLTAGAATTHDGETLTISRDTSVVQIWEGLASTANGLENQLDQLTRAIQDTQTDGAHTLRVEGTWRTNVTELLADNLMEYTPGLLTTVDPGANVRTLEEGFAYEVADSAATDHHLETAGGVKLYVLPGSDGTYNFAAINPAADGVTDDFPKLRALLDVPGTGTGYVQSSPPIHIPNGEYYMSQSIELKRSTRIFGNSSGLPTTDTAKLIFPTDTMGITVNRFNTLNGGVEAVPTTAADGSIIEGIQLISTPGPDTTKHGIWLRARAVLRNIIIDGFSGNGLYVAADASGPDNLMGNTNNWFAENMRITGCGIDGVQTLGGDANAGYASNIDATGNTEWGIRDQSFLGNNYIGCHAAANGTGPYAATNANGRNLFLGCYSEAGQANSSIIARSVFMGGTQGAGVDGSGLIILDGEIYNATLKGSSEEGAFAPGYGDSVYGFWSPGDTNVWSFKKNGDEYGYTFANLASEIHRPLRLQFTSLPQQGGANGVKLSFPVGFYLGWASSKRFITYLSSLPTVGDYTAGDIILNAAPAAAGKAGWICTTSGTAGSTAVFKPFGAIDA